MSPVRPPTTSDTTAAQVRAMRDLIKALIDAGMLDANIRTDVLGLSEDPNAPTLTRDQRRWVRRLAQMKDGLREVLRRDTELDEAWQSRDSRATPKVPVKRFMVWTREHGAKTRGTRGKG
jgi:hypothetical protein